MNGDLDGAHTIGRWLTDRAGGTSDRTAIDDRGVRIGYGDLEARARELAASLRRAGYGPGDRLATITGNSIDHVVVFFACAKAGIAMVPLSWRLSSRELSEALVHAAPALVAIEDEYLGVANDALARLDAPPPTTLLGTTGIEAAVPRRGDGRDAAPARAVRDDDPLLVIYTSGSEAAPKGVVLTHANCFWNNLALAGVAQLTTEDIVLAVLPQFHVAAWNCQPLLAWWAGATVVLERSFQPRRVLQLLAERGVTAMMGVPTQYRLLIDDPGFAALARGRLRQALVGGATIPPALAARWADAGVPLTQGYGLTEAAPNVLCLPASESRAHPGAAGRPYPHVDVRVVDPDSGLELGGEATGELWVRGPSVFAGYLHDAEATARAMAGPWLRTGDIVHRDRDGVFRIVDRRKDIFISGGENVAPAEVERALLLHPAIADAAVVGVPDDVWGERGVAFVVRAEGAALGTDEVLAHARAELASFKVPVRVAFVDELPRSTIEKLARSRLRARAADMVRGSAREHS